MITGVKFRSTWRAFLTTVSLLILCSCQNTQVINRIKLIQTAGYDLEGKEVHSTALIGNYKEKEKINIEVLEAKSKSSFDMIPRLNQKSNDPIQYGQMRMMVFGMDYAKQGVGPVLSILSRDVKVSGRLKLGVTDSKAADLLKATLSTHDPLYLMHMVAQNERNDNVPKVNLHTALYNYYSEGIDLYLPLITMGENEEITVNGMALFQQDRLISTISDEQSLWLKVLTENARNGFFVMPIKESESPREGHALIRLASTQPSFSIQSSEAPLSLGVKLKVKVIVKNLPEDISLKTASEVKKFEYELKEYISHELESFIHFCCMKQTDPIGIGNLFRSRTRNWDEKRFYEAYSSLRSHVQVQLEIVQCGTQD